MSLPVVPGSLSLGVPLGAPLGACDVAHVLALCDRSPASLNAAWRAAQVARDLRVPMRLVHAGANASSSALPPALAAFIREASERCGVQVEPVPVSGDPVAQCVPLARNALVVLPTEKGNPLREWLLGSPAERLIRLVRAPVLVVKHVARSAYRRVMVAVDLLPASDHLVAQGAALSRGAPLATFHALTPDHELALRETDAPAHVLRAHRSKRANRALARMGQLLHGRTGQPLVSFGGAAASILAGETGHRADLIVIGKRRRGLLADFLLGSVTRQVLARSEADVLVVPLPGAGVWE